MRRGWWPVTGLLAGLVTGALWGWFGSGGYEAGDAMLGTSFLCGLAGLGLGAVAYEIARRR